jgi:hypothetical protein
MIRSRRDAHGQRIGLWERLDARLRRCDTLTFSSAGFARATLPSRAGGTDAPVTEPSPASADPDDTSHGS